MVDDNPEVMLTENHKGVNFSLKMPETTHSVIWLLHLRWSLFGMLEVY